MIRRSGTTLVEVLVAIFVTALGLLGLLALFPLGAVSMAQAIKDGRCAQAAANAAALAEAMNIRNDLLVRGNSDQAFVRRGTEAPASPDGPSYPVYVDPIGLVLGAKDKYLPTNAGNQYAIFRQNVSFVTNLHAAVRWFTLLDDLNFPKESPILGGGSVQREGRYSWAYMLRRPRSSDTSIVDLTVIVYSGRPVVFGQGETAYTNVTFDPGNNVVRVRWVAGQEKPALRAGGWILDATTVKSVRLPGQLKPTLSPDPHGFFYRVVNVSDPGVEPGTGKFYVDLELQTKPKHATTEGVLVVLDGVAEVFERGPGWRP